ncbi:Dabb family protein [Alteromonas sp. BL110]|nr:Dabb family protein [Alteromonas sp. BL110]RKM82233.1 Dabb family protein [Alteromonas sp. BL110]
MTDIKRRQFVTSASALASFAALPASASSPISLPSDSAKSSSMKNSMLPPILHMVYFWLNNSGSNEDRAKLIAGLESLKAIPQIHSLHIGVPANTLKRDVIDNSFDVSELMFFESIEAQNEYQSHPIHKQFVKQCSGLWSKVVVRDSVSV